MQAVRAADEFNTCAAHCLQMRPLSSFAYLMQVLLSQVTPPTLILFIFYFPFFKIKKNHLPLLMVLINLFWFGRCELHKNTTLTKYSTLHFFCRPHGKIVVNWSCLPVEQPFVRVILAPYTLGGHRCFRGVRKLATTSSCGAIFFRRGTPRFQVGGVLSIEFTLI